MRVTREHVAKQAGVSVATVSYVFSGQRYVSEELKERVLRVSKELNYYPDMVARSLMTNRTNTISVLTSDISSPLQMEVIKGIQEAAIEDHYFVAVFGGTKNLEGYIDNFISRKVDGAFISVMTQELKDDYIKKLLDFGISVAITATREVDDDRVCGLELDMAGGMQKIIRYLTGLHHRDIAYISAFDDLYTADRRLRSFRRYMQEIAGEEQPLVIKGSMPYDSTIESGYALTKALLDQERPFTAVVCTNDMMAFGAIKALREAGRRVPEDVSVVGIDDIIFSRSFTPALTTLSHGGMAYGRRIYNILMDSINNGAHRRETFETELVVRESTAENRR